MKIFNKLFNKNKVKKDFRIYFNIQPKEILGQSEITGHRQVKLENFNVNTGEKFEIICDEKIKDLIGNLNARGCKIMHSCQGDLPDLHDAYVFLDYENLDMFVVKRLFDVFFKDYYCKLFVDGMGIYAGQKPKNI